MLTRHHDHNKKNLDLCNFLIFTCFYTVQVVHFFVLLVTSLATKTQQEYSQNITILISDFYIM